MSDGSPITPTHAPFFLGQKARNTITPMIIHTHTHTHWLTERVVVPLIPPSAGSSETPWVYISKAKVRAACIHQEVTQ